MDTVTELSERQGDVLRCIAERLEGGGVCPTYREIGDALGIRSTNGVSEHVTALIRKGYLCRPEGKGSARGLSLTTKGLDVIDPDPTRGLIEWALERVKDGDGEVMKVIGLLQALRAQEQGEAGP